MINEAVDFTRFDLKRFLITLTEPIKAFPTEITVEEDFVVHHLRNVVRARQGEPVILVDEIREIAYGALIEEVQKNWALFSIQTCLPGQSEASPSATLAVSLIKEQRWDTLLQKTAELGARAFQPLQSERSVIRLSTTDFPKKLARWQSVVRGAAEQSEGLFTPRILNPLSVAQFCAQNFAENTLKLLLAERGLHRQTLKAALSNRIKPGQPVIFAVGPEGGWTDAELDSFHQAGFVSVSLGNRIMRSETAAIAAMAALVYEQDSKDLKATAAVHE